MATATAAPRGGARVHVQKFGTFLSNMVLPNIGAFIAWGLITALFIHVGLDHPDRRQVFGFAPGLEDGQYDYGFVSALGGWNGVDGGIVGPMITYLLPILIGYTGGRMMYDDNIRGGVVGAIATMGAIAGAPVPMFLGAMIMGPLGGWSMKKHRRHLGRQDQARLRDARQQLLRRHLGHDPGDRRLLRSPARSSRSSWTVAENVVDFLVDKNLLPLTSVFVEPAKVLFLNNAINHGVFTPLGTSRGGRERQVDPVPHRGQPRPRPRPAAGVHASSARAWPRRRLPARPLIQFVGGIHEIYFPYVLMKPKLIAVIAAA